MITDRELDDRLTAAAGIRDAELPALPDDFLRFVTEADESASVVAARQLAAESRTAPRRRRPSRKTFVRAGAGVLVVAAAWTTAVVVDLRPERPPVVAAPDAQLPAEPTPLPLDPPGGLTLVAAEAITFPYSLDPAPEGLTPVLSRGGGLEMFGAVEPLVYSARYSSADDPGFTFTISERDPRVPPPGAQLSPPYTDDEVEDRGTTAVAGRPADFTRATLSEPSCTYAPAPPTQQQEPEQVCGSAYAELYWQRADGLWVGLVGWGDRYGSETALVSVGQSIVDRPQPVQLQFGLAPEGWAVSSYESLGNLALVDEADPTNPSARVAVSLLEQWRGYDSPDVVLRGMADGNPVEELTVKGRSARLVSVPDHFADLGSGTRMWYLAGEFRDGTGFLLQAPDTLSREDVLAMAEGMSYTA
ncbi:hypothetical protein DQ237_02350 [Blastococcus sp. TF02-8]|uniref:hypothetical protein n=1 Tax=Blastococcus sp. TF02-8 TaxID=2250574 RepID=UPI000DEBA5DA|nr:hypothetical protein [Blastococcus sp. TF02-8]RBY97776.1 hypothetical protein DQ237_02350 [Blastococcus sp. TF02-8]